MTFADYLVVFVGSGVFSAVFGIIMHWMHEGHWSRRLLWGTVTAAIFPPIGWIVMAAYWDKLCDMCGCRGNPSFSDRNLVGRVVGMVIPLGFIVGAGTLSNTFGGVGRLLVVLISAGIFCVMVLVAKHFKIPGRFSQGRHEERECVKLLSRTCPVFYFDGDGGGSLWHHCHCKAEPPQGEHDLYASCTCVWHWTHACEYGVTPEIEELCAKLRAIENAQKRAWEEGHE